MKPTTKPKLTVDMVKTVYNGRPGCACGCRGEYKITRRSISLLLSKFETTDWEKIVFIPESETLKDDGAIFYWDSNETRCHAIYLNPGAYKEEK